MRQAQAVQARVYYHDTDASGLMYYAAYLTHLEEGRYAFCVHSGIDLGEYARQGVVFPVVHVEIEYRSPARYGESICVYTKVEKIGHSSIHFSQEIKKGDLLLVAARTVWACVGRNQTSIALPQAIQAALR